MPDPQAVVLDLVYGRWRSQALYAGANLGVFDAVAEQPRSAASIAEQLGVAPDALYRLLRALASIGLLSEQEDRSFSITETGRLLRSDDPRSLRDMALLTEGPEHYAVWKHLTAIVKDGAPNGFVREFAVPAFEYASRTPSYQQAFDRAMTSYSRAQTAWALEALERRDLAGMAHVCDVGGGQGHLLCHLLLKYPHLHGTVLDRPEVFDRKERLWARQLGLLDRCEYQPGDMFASVPPADGYFMKLILHDWSDEECDRILSTICRCAPAGARLFVVEHVVPSANTPHVANFFDLHMMCWGTGRERTLDEYRNLLEHAGWSFVGHWSPAAGPISVIEAHKA